MYFNLEKTMTYLCHGGKGDGDEGMDDICSLL